MERRSATRATPRRVYTVDAFEVAGIEEVQDRLSVQSDTSPSARDGDTEDGFDSNATESTSEDEMSQGEDNPGDEASDGDSAAGERLLDETMSIVADSDEANEDLGIRLDNAVRTKATASDSVRTYTRGSREFIARKGAKDVRRRCYFGPSTKEYQPIHSAMIKWAYEPTLPSRISDRHGFGGMRRSFFLLDESSAEEANRHHHWWIRQAAKSTFLTNQTFESVDSQQVLDYLPEWEADEVSFIMGPFKSPRFFSLPVGKTMSLQSAWAVAQPDKQQLSISQSKRVKRGWLLNLGASVQHVDWAPMEGADEQYLAVSVKTPFENTNAPFQEPTAPAFTARPSYKSTIQIWRFQATSNGTVDIDRSPQLNTVICTDWGGVKALKWAPIACDEALELGLLAGIWSDGALRILYVTKTNRGEETAFVYAKQAAFESRPPGTICTCLAWISDQRVVAGCANGSIAIWDLPTILSSHSRSTRPTIYSSVTTSSILSVTSCYPSRPSMLLVGTLNGYIAMTDLDRTGQSLCTQASTVFNNRTRLGHPLLTWHDYTQTILHVDDGIALRGSAIRRLFATVDLGRCGSSVTCLASSRCHPCVLVGTAQGDIFATNPTKRMVDATSPVWQQTWFAHEWRRPSTEEIATAIESNDIEGTNGGGLGLEHGIPVNGLSRISEGFRAERAMYLSETHRDPGNMFATIYEEKSAITAVAWNPNLHTGGWAAAGMADGLLRVEDIAT